LSVYSQSVRMWIVNKLSERTVRNELLADYWCFMWFYCCLQKEHKSMSNINYYFADVQRCCIVSKVDDGSTTQTSAEASKTKFPLAAVTLVLLC